MGCTVTGLLPPGPLSLRAFAPLQCYPRRTFAPRPLLRGPLPLKGFCSPNAINGNRMQRDQKIGLLIQKRRASVILACSTYYIIQMRRGPWGAKVLGVKGSQGQKALGQRTRG